MSEFKIPFCKTTLGDEEIKAVSECIKSGWVVLGAKSQEFEEKFAEYVGAKHAIFVDSGTNALFLSLQYLKEKMLVHTLAVVPSLTFTATAEAAINAGFYVEFGDVDLDTLCLKTDAIDKVTLPVHLLGNKASQKDALVYDSAHRIEKDDVKGSKALWCYSFYATKNLTTVQGGMIATNDTKAYEWLKMARDHGLDMGTKERYTGKYKQYDVKFVGYRCKGDDLRAVMGLEQLKKLPDMQAKRNAIVKRYNEAFGANQVGNHVYTILVDDRESFISQMIEQGVQVTVHFRPLHLMTGYKRWYSEGYSPKLPVTEYVGERIVSLPLFPDLTKEEQEHIIRAVNKTNLRICQKNIKIGQ